MSEVRNKRTISVSVETHEKLKALGGYDDTMDEIVMKCVDFYRESKQ
jgi:hypothetical protein